MRRPLLGRHGGLQTAEAAKSLSPLSFGFAEISARSTGGKAGADPAPGYLHKAAGTPGSEFGNAQPKAITESAHGRAPVP